MWNYEKKLQYPVKIARTDVNAAKIIMSQFGGLNTKKIYKESPKKMQRKKGTWSKAPSYTVKEKRKRHKSIKLYKKDRQ